MNFEQGHLYHIFNQGNNRQRIFFSRGNYLFFIKKVRIYILPYADILAWCLMPNHFHIMLEIKEVSRPILKGFGSQGGEKDTLQRQRTINDSMAIMLRSYTRAINKAERRSGSLFRMGTKALCMDSVEKVSAPYYKRNGVTYINNSRGDYPQTCFNYIHHNPVKARLVRLAQEWEYSSAMEYARPRTSNLVNRERAQELGLIISDSNWG